MVLTTLLVRLQVSAIQKAVKLSGTFGLTVYNNGTIELTGIDSLTNPHIYVRTKFDNMAPKQDKTFRICLTDHLVDVIRNVSHDTILSIRSMKDQLERDEFMYTACFQSPSGLCIYSESLSTMNRDVFLAENIPIEHITSTEVEVPGTFFDFIDLIPESDSILRFEVEEFEDNPAITLRTSTTIDSNIFSASWNLTDVQSGVYCVWNFKQELFRTAMNLLDTSRPVRMNLLQKTDFPARLTQGSLSIFIAPYITEK